MKVNAHRVIIEHIYVITHRHVIHIGCTVL